MTELRRSEVAILRGIVTVILPPYPDLDAATRRTVEQDVTSYVARQIHSMPSFLRLPYRLALFAFAWLPLFRYGHWFGSLPPDRRVSYLASWNDARFAPMRDFVKLIRSIALLAYFDHSLTRARLDDPATELALGEPHKAANE